jgi:predicted Zn-dependent protease
VKSSMWVPSGNIEPLAGTNQYPGEDYFPLGVSVAKQLQDTNARTYFIVLTDRDLNTRAQNFRFQYSLHSPMVRTSVLSVARLFYERDGTQAPIDIVGMRTQKMLMRIVGEMRLGWKRTNDPTDLMYAPIMSIEDIDRMSLIHTVQRRKQQ